MKNYVTYGLLAITVILIIFITQAGSLLQDEKITAFNASLVYEGKGDLTKAIDELLKVYEKNKSNYLLNVRLGWLYYETKDYSNSKKYYQEAIKLNQSSIEAMTGITLSLSALKEWNEVQAVYENILKIDPNHYTANLRLGQIYLSNASYANAKKYLETANLQYPAEYEPNLSLGWTYYYLGNTAKAKELLTNALMLSPNDSLATQGLMLVK
ncbi:MAG: tetratricopeptide repeat protein [Ignavibacteriaceae bacterium]